MKPFLPFIFVALTLLSCSEKERKIDFYVTCPNCDVVYGVDGQKSIEDEERRKRDGFHASLTGKKDDGATLSIHNIGVPGVIRLRIVADGETVKDETTNTNEDGSSGFYIQAIIP